MAKYFTFDELTRSMEADCRNIGNTPPPEAVRALYALADNLLDPVRELWGGPIRVNSGFRCPALNRIVGGSPTSQHLRGEAADITTGSRENNRRLFRIVVSANLPFDQLIDERGYLWIHISYREGSNRRKILHL